MHVLQLGFPDLLVNGLVLHSVHRYDAALLADISRDPAEGAQVEGGVGVRIARLQPESAEEVWRSVVGAAVSGGTGSGDRKSTAADGDGCSVTGLADDASVRSASSAVHDRNIGDRGQQFHSSPSSTFFDPSATANWVQRSRLSHDNMR